MEYPPETGGGGIGSYVAIIGEALTRRGHEIHVLSCVPGQASSDRRDGAVHVHRRGTPELGRLDGLLRSGKARLRLEVAGACFREYRRLRLDFDVVESPDWMAEGFVFALLGSKPLVGHLHTPLLVLATHNDKPRTWDRRFGDAIERVTMSRAHVVTSPSHLLADDLSASGWLGDREARVIRLPLDLDQWAALPSPEAAPPRILWVGRLEPRKAPETLVEAAARLAAEINDLEVVFVGGSNYSRDGKPYAEWTAALARKLESPCRFVDFVPRTDLPSWYARVRVAVLTARYDNFPVAGLEAMAAGRPLVTTSKTGVAELVGGAEAGAVVPPRDPTALAEALRPYLLDPARAGADGRRARNVIELHCSPDRVAAERELAYEEAVLRWRATLTGRTLTRIGQRARASSSSSYRAP
jgi:glycosyltransferase involved in cell wall biosynthesis